MYENKYLMHYGKRGMKWGVRNEDRPVSKDGGKPAHLNSDYKGTTSIGSHRSNSDPADYKTWRKLTTPNGNILYVNPETNIAVTKEEAEKAANTYKEGQKGESKTKNGLSVAINSVKNSKKVSKVKGAIDRFINKK